MRKFLTFALLVLATACVSNSLRVGENDSLKVRVMTYNVENLFDTEDEEFKNDETFLPKTTKASLIIQNRCRVQNPSRYRQMECLEKNWSKSILERKLERLTDVLAQVNNKRGPDILILQEVENRAVIEYWRDNYLKNFGYTSLAHIESEDERGIDNAILSRLPMIGEPRQYPLDYSTAPEEVAEEDRRPTRGILEARFRLPDGHEVLVYSVHFPSQGAPTIHRRVAVQTLMALTAKHKGKSIIVGGDFNITAKEEWKEKLFRNLIASRFAVSHFVGCKGCVGTTYYHRDRTWSFFDVLLFSPDFLSESSNWRLNPQSIRVINSSIYQTNRWGSPARFGNGRGSVGVSDHWPVYAEIEHQPPAKVFQ